MRLIPDRKTALKHSRYYLDRNNREIRECRGYYLRDTEGRYYEPAFGVMPYITLFAHIWVWTEDNKLRYIDPANLEITTFSQRVAERIAPFFTVRFWRNGFRLAINGIRFALWMDTSPPER